MVKSKAFNRGLNLYVGLSIVYTLSVNIIGSGLIVTFSRWLLFFVSIFFYLMVMMNSDKKPFIIWSLGLLYLLFFIYGSFLIIEAKEFHAWRATNIRIRSFLYLLQITESLLPVFVFYYYSKLGVLNKKYMTKNILLFLSFIVISYIINWQRIQMLTESEEVTNNSGYLVLSFFPMLAFLKMKSARQYLLFGFCTLLIFFAMKRGAILISVVCLLVYFIYLFKESRGVNFWKVAIIFLIAIAAINYTYDYLLNSSAYFQLRVENTMEGDSSGRDLIFDFFYNYFINETDTKEFLFGLGANATLDIYGQYAHNDWLEIAINQGCLGLIIHLAYWISFLLLCRKKNDDPQVKAALIMLFSIYFLKTLFSMSYRDYTLYSSMAFGYCIARSYIEGKTSKDLDGKRVNKQLIK